MNSKTPDISFVKQPFYEDKYRDFRIALDVTETNFEDFYNSIDRSRTKEFNLIFKALSSKSSKKKNALKDKNSNTVKNDEKDKNMKTEHRKLSRVKKDKENKNKSVDLNLKENESTSAKKKQIHTRKTTRNHQPIAMIATNTNQTELDDIKEKKQTTRKTKPSAGEGKAVNKKNDERKEETEASKIKRTKTTVANKRNLRNVKTNNPEKDNVGEEKKKKNNSGKSVNFQKDGKSTEKNSLGDKSLPQSGNDGNENDTNLNSLKNKDDEKNKVVKLKKNKTNIANKRNLRSVKTNNPENDNGVGVGKNKKSDFEKSVSFEIDKTKMMDKALNDKSLLQSDEDVNENDGNVNSSTELTNSMIEEDGNIGRSKGSKLKPNKTISARKWNLRSDKTKNTENDSQVEEENLQENSFEKGSLSQSDKDVNENVSTVSSITEVTENIDEDIEKTAVVKHKKTKSTVQKKRNLRNVKTNNPENDNVVKEDANKKNKFEKSVSFEIDEITDPSGNESLSLSDKSVNENDNMETELINKSVHSESPIATDKTSEVEIGCSLNLTANSEQFSSEKQSESPFEDSAYFEEEMSLIYETDFDLRENESTGVEKKQKRTKKITRNHQPITSNTKNLEIDDVKERRRTRMMKPLPAAEEEIVNTGIDKNDEINEKTKVSKLKRNETTLSNKRNLRSVKTNEEEYNIQNEEGNNKKSKSEKSVTFEIDKTNMINDASNDKSLLQSDEDVNENDGNVNSSTELTNSMIEEDGNIGRSKGSKLKPNKTISARKWNLRSDKTKNTENDSQVEEENLQENSFEKGSLSQSDKDVNENVSTVSSTTEVTENIDENIGKTAVVKPKKTKSTVPKKRNLRNVKTNNPENENVVKEDANKKNKFEKSVSFEIDETTDPSGNESLSLSDKSVNENDNMETELINKSVHLESPIATDNTSEELIVYLINLVPKQEKLSPEKQIENTILNPVSTSENFDQSFVDKYNPDNNLKNSAEEDLEHLKECFIFSNKKQKTEKPKIKKTTYDIERENAIRRRKIRFEKKMAKAIQKLSVYSMKELKKLHLVSNPALKDYLNLDSDSESTSDSDGSYSESSSSRYYCSECSCTSDCSCSCCTDFGSSSDSEDGSGESSSTCPLSSNDDSDSSSSSIKSDIH